MLHLSFIFLFFVIIECVIFYKWLPVYFNFGIPIYLRTYHFEEAVSTPIGELSLNQAFNNMLAGSLVFKDLGQCKFAFREKFFEFKLFTFTPIMRGRLEIDKKTKKIRVFGLINFWSLSLIMYLMIAFYNKVEFLLFLFLILSAIYLTQRIRYNSVGQFVYEWYSRDWSK
jgi:hypothetical protein